jgi:ABC-type nitrate/sulfonate/bicarbonate transport system substrate-binding protein
MTQGMTRRTAIGRLIGTGLSTSGVLGGGLLSTACSSRQPQGLQVRVISAQGIVSVTLQSLMSARGYFRQQGLDARTLSIASGTNIIGALLRQDADICIFAGFSQLLAAIEKGADLKILAGASIKGQQSLLAKSPDIQYVKDLKGRTLGVGAVGAQLYQVAIALLRKKAIDPATVRFVSIGSSADVFRAVAAGTVDAGDGEADVFAIMDSVGVHALRDGDYAVELPEYTWQASFTSTASIRSKREVLVRTLAAYCEAYRYVQAADSKDAFIKAQLDALQPGNHDIAIKRATSQWNYLQTRKPYAEDLLLSEERVDYMQRLNIELGVQKRMLPYDQLVDASLAREAVARLA